MLHDHYELEDYVPQLLTPWLLRLILDDRLTVDKKLQMSEIAQKIKDEYDVSVMRGRLIDRWGCGGQARVRSRPLEPHINMHVW